MSRYGLDGAMVEVISKDNVTSSTISKGKVMSAVESGHLSCNVSSCTVLGHANITQRSTTTDTRGSFIYGRT